MDHAHKFVSDDGDVIAWDYSKYDVRMSSQITLSVWKAFIELAEYGGYDQRSLRIMRMMISDIVHPLLDYNGTLMMAFSMNTSGNNMTVNVNGTAGSFYVRMGFFNQYPNCKDFRSAVAALTYGDDFIGSVKEEYRDFNFITYKNFLAKYDVKITLPNKSDDEVQFMNIEEADFLKRQSNYIPEIDCKIGRIDEQSLFKSLHMNLRSKTALPTEVAASCVESAMHEWFAFGRETYELRRQQMKEVCKRANIIVPILEVDFDERVNFWKRKYISSD